MAVVSRFNLSSAHRLPWLMIAHTTSCVLHTATTIITELFDTEAFGIAGSTAENRRLIEVAEDRLSDDGVVKDEALRQAVLSNIRTFIDAETPWSVINQMQSLVEGAKGNTEFLFHIQ